MSHAQGVLHAQLLSGQAIAPGFAALECKWWHDASGGGAATGLFSPSVWSPAGQPDLRRVEAAP